MNSQNYWFIILVNCTLERTACWGTGSLGYRAGLSNVVRGDEFILSLSHVGMCYFQRSSNEHSHWNMRSHRENERLG